MTESRVNLALSAIAATAAVAAGAAVFCDVPEPELLAASAVVLLSTPLRTWQWYQLAAKGGRALNFGEVVFSFVSSLVVCAWTLVAILIAFVLSAEIIDFFFPGPSIIVAGLCVYFLLAEPWLFPQRYFDKYARPPT